MMNHRLTVAAGIAVLAAALSLYSLLVGSHWMMASIGAVAAVALAGTLTRLATVQAAIAACVAALLAVVPVLAGYGWPGWAGAAALIALTAASATGARLLRLFAACATYFSVPLLYLNAVFARATSWGAVIPTSRSLAALAKLPARASKEFHYAPPIPTIRPVEYVTVAGVTAIAICVDVLAVRLRRPAMAGLPLLLLFSVPVASSLKSFGILQTLACGIAIAAYLSLLSADGRQRLRMWGRLVTIRRTHAGDETSQGPDTRQIAASGRRVGLTAVALAMVVPVFLAGTAPKDIFAKARSGGTGGGLAIPGGIAPLDTVGTELSQKPVLELTYRTTNSQPQDQYLQEYVLNYDYAANGRWLPSSSAGQAAHGQQLPYPVPGLGTDVPIADVRTTVSMARATNSPLPLPYAPVQVSITGRALIETAGTLMVFDPRQATYSHLTAVSREAEPTAAELQVPAAYPPSIVRSYTGYRGPQAQQLRRIARQHTAGDTTALQKAVDLESWLTSPAFSYTLRAKWPNSGPWLLNFLTHDMRGDCQQFAPAFAVLARLLGIPSRVAVGFTAGTPAGHGLWQVTSADAHAWPESYFPGAGWIRFEPTPSGKGEQGTATTPAYAKDVLRNGSGPGGQPTPSAATPSGGASGRVSPGTQPKPKQLQPGEGPAGSARGGSGFPVGTAVAVAIFLLLAGPALGRWLTTRRRWLAASTDSARAQTAWRELLDYLTDYGISSLPSESPRAISRRITGSAALDPAATIAMTRIGAAEERARYSLGSLPGAGLRADVVTVRRALAASSTRMQRLRARLLPASTLDRIRRALQSTSHALSWIDSPLPTWRRGHGQSEGA